MDKSKSFRIIQLLYPEKREYCGGCYQIITNIMLVRYSLMLSYYWETRLWKSFKKQKNKKRSN